MMTIQEIRQLTPKKMWAKLREMRRTLAVTKFHAATGQEQDTAKMRKIKKTIARIKTVVNNPQNSEK